MPLPADGVGAVSPGVVPPAGTVLPPAGEPDAPSGKGKIAALAAAVVAIVVGLGAAFFLLGRDEDAPDETSSLLDSVPETATSVDVSEPTSVDSAAPESSVTDPPTSDETGAPSSDLATTDEAVTDDPDGTTSDAADPASSTTETAADNTPDTAPAPFMLDEVGALLVWTSFSADVLDDGAQQAEIDRLIAEPAVEAVADPGPVSAICAGIPVDADFDLTIRWLYVGLEIRSEPVSATVPGVGSCLTNEGNPLDPGSYQVLATNDDQSEVGFATTFVVGASPISQLFVNNGDDDICDVAIAPLDTAYYELFESEAGPLTPGERLVVDVADVELEMRIGLCDGTDLEPVRFQPSAGGEQMLIP